MATAHVVVVKLLIDADKEEVAMDGIFSLLSDHLQFLEEKSCLIDWEYESMPVPVSIPEDYEPEDGIPESTCTTVSVTGRTVSDDGSYPVVAPLPTGRRVTGPQYVLEADYSSVELRIMNHLSEGELNTSFPWEKDTT